MKPLSRLLLLLGALGLAALSSLPAYALPTCDHIQGWPCSPEGKVWNCNWIGGGGGVCFCFDGHWEC